MKRPPAGDRRGSAVHIGMDAVSMMLPPALEDALQAAYVRMLSRSARFRQDGYLTGRQALDVARGKARVLQLLCTPACGGR